MKKAMVEQWDNPARINELHMRLDTLPCKRSISEYARQYQEIEAQIPLKDMSPGDHIYKFITHLPPELYMTSFTELSKIYPTSIPLPGSGKAFRRSHRNLQLRRVKGLQVQNSSRSFDPLCNQLRLCLTSQMRPHLRPLTRWIWMR